MQTTQFSASTDNSNSKKGEQQQNTTFLYGSHYSTPAFVLFYLVRQHPEWQLCLQNGRFDHPNRLFHSIDDTWRNCLTIDSDVKELLPEFYDLGNAATVTAPSHQEDSAAADHSKSSSPLGVFLRNDLELDLGVRSDGVRVNHVVLPPWAHNSTTRFIQRMRDALESAHVSEHLHKWIDLIFGYKQRGQGAIDSDNLFYYLCYEGAVDLDSIKDYSQRKSLEIQIQEFGQIPTQLFKTPHLPKVKPIVGELVDLEFISSAALPLPPSQPQPQQTLSSSSSSMLPPQTSSSASTSASTPLYSNSISVERTNKTSSLTSTTSRTSPSSSSPYRICPTAFGTLEVKLSVKMHKSHVNDLVFLDEHIPQTNVDSQVKPDLPLVCSVSNDNWIKIYSLHERSVFRSHNVSNFSISSVDYVQIWKAEDIYSCKNGLADILDDDESSTNVEDEFNGSSFESLGSGASGKEFLGQSDTKFSQTLLFLSCWDNSIYVYDMNYNRCIYQVSDSHDDAISRLALVKIPESRSFLLVSGSWDSSIKVWLTSSISTPRRSRSSMTASSGSGSGDQHFKLQFLNELSHDSAVRDFCLTRTYLASLCDDGDVLLWRLNLSGGQTANGFKAESINHTNNTDSDEDESDYERSAQFKLSGRFARLPEQPSLETTYVHEYSIEHTAEMGKITDCRLIEAIAVAGSSISTLAICTSNGFVKIYNLNTSTELFSIQISVPTIATPARLNKLIYTNDYILTIDAAGFIYFVDLQQQSETTSSSSFLSHHIKLSSSSLTSIAVYKDLIIACGDSDGYLHFISLIDI